MVSCWTDDSNLISYAVNERFKHNKIPIICYPVGLCAYFVDQLLFFNIPVEVLLDEIDRCQIRSGKKNLPKPFLYELSVAKDSLIANKYHLLLSQAVKDAEIYDIDSFTDFIIRTSSMARHLGLKPNASKFIPPTNRIPRIISY